MWHRGEDAGSGLLSLPCRPPIVRPGTLLCRRFPVWKMCPPEEGPSPRTVVGAKWVRVWTAPTDRCSLLLPKAYVWESAHDLGSPEL